MIPINDLGRLGRDSQKSILAEMAEVIIKGNYILGENSEKFESNLARHLGVLGCVAVGSGTDALIFAFRAIGLRAGDTIVATPNAGGYSAIAARIIGISVVYVDCDDQGRMSVESLADALEFYPQVRGVVVTHLFGLASPVSEIRYLCNAKGIFLIEDCAQSIGGSLENRALGSFGDVSTFSFYPTKNLGALGDGGAIASSDSHVLDRARALRQYGWSQKYKVMDEFGQNSRMDEFQAVVLNHKLGSLENHTEVRREIWTRYSRALDGSSWRLIGSNGRDFVAHLAVVVAPRGLREESRWGLEKLGVSTAIHYPVLDYDQLPWQDSKRMPCPIAQDLSERIFSIPIFPELEEGEIQTIEASLKKVSGIS